METGERIGYCVARNFILGRYLCLCCGESDSKLQRPWILHGRPQEQYKVPSLACQVTDAGAATMHGINPFMDYAGRLHISA